MGIYGSVPGTSAGEVLLGDVIISKTVIQHTLGRQYLNKFITKDTVDDSLRQPNTDIRTLITSFKTKHRRKRLQHKARQYLKDLQSTAIQKRHQCKYQYPKAADDKLFTANYRHKHQGPQKCKCNQEIDGLYNKATQALYSKLLYNKRQLVL
jgi:hypothetical protein